jgi:hypothetical protein
MDALCHVRYSSVCARPASLAQVVSVSQRARELAQQASAAGSRSAGEARRLLEAFSETRLPLTTECVQVSL